MTGLKFVNFYVNGIMTGSKLVQFSRVDGLREIVVVNDDPIVFPIGQAVEGTPLIVIQGSMLDMSMDHVQLKAGDTVSVAAKDITLNVVVS